MVSINCHCLKRTTKRERESEREYLTDQKMNLERERERDRQREREEISLTDFAEKYIHKQRYYRLLHLNNWEEDWHM